MKFTIGSRFSQNASFLLTIFISLFLVWNSAKSWLAYNYAGDPPPDGFKEAITVEDSNSQLYFLLGQYYDNYEYSTSRDQVYKLYKKAIELNPLNYNYWYYLAEFLSEENLRDKALFALNQATELSPGVVALRWEAGMLASTLGDEKSLSDNLRAVITYDPERRNKAFIVLWQTLRNGDKILKIIPQQAIPDYLDFLIKTKRVPESYKVWINNKKIISYNLFMYFMNFLIYQKATQLAKNAWVDRYGDWEGIWNGDFEHEILNNGFDWTISDVEGAKITRTKNTTDTNHTLKIEFDGKHNLDFYHFRQVVPVDENSKYMLSANMKSENLTSSNGLFWEVYCLHDENLFEKSDAISGSTDWHKVKLSFEPPSGCNSVVIRLRRLISNKLNNTISGIVWIDNVDLEKVK